MFSIFKKQRRVILVLGGGSARGVAHIGVLKVLERERIPINAIVGTSMGALVGAAYSTGLSLREMEAKALKFNSKKLLDPTVPKMGLLAGDRLEGIIRDLIDTKGFDNCRIPLSVVTTDIETGEEVVYQSGNLVKVVRASCSWPGIFNPVKIDGKVLSDGGIKNSVPTKMANASAGDYVIAVDVGFCVKRGRMENIFQIILQSFQIMGEELSKYQSRNADVVIKVELGDIDQVAFERSKEAIDKGVDAAEAKVGEIKRELGMR